MAVTSAEILALFSDASRLVINTDKFLIEGTTGTIKIPAEYVRSYLIAGVAVTIGEDGYWYIGGTKQDTKAAGDSIELRREASGITWYKNGVYQGVVGTWEDVGFYDIAVSFAAAALTNPYTSGLTPRRIGDIAVNTTSLEIWNANSTTASTDSWQIASQGKYGGTLITDTHSIIRNGFYSAISTAANLPTNTESFYIQAMCSNLSNTSAILTAIGLTTGKMYMQRKVSGVWGSWAGGITQAELAYLSGVSSNVQAQLDAKADKTYVDGDKMDVTAHAITALQSQIEALQLKIAEITSGQVVIPALMTDRLTSVSDNMHISGSGAPTVPPDYLYQEYIDTVAKVVYMAYGNTAVSDWKLI